MSKIIWFGDCGFGFQVRRRNTCYNNNLVPKSKEASVREDQLIALNRIYDRFSRLYTYDLILGRVMFSFLRIK
jgi:hypothetical protein